MRILYDCFSCSPYYGSDEGIGWLWPYHMRKYHDVWVLVRKDRKADIEKYCSEYNITDINFIYCDIPDWMNFYYKNLKNGKNGVLDFLLYQYLWQFPALKAARKADKEFDFDIIHHVSTNDFRLLGRLYKLNKPYIIGPIGGAQETVEALKPYVVNYSRSEKLRDILNKLLTAVPSYKKAVNAAEIVYFSNTETMDYLKKYIHNTDKCCQLTEVGCSDLQPYKNKSIHDKFTFLWAGRMEYRKGLEFLLDAAAKLPKNNSWKLLLCGDGSEMEHCRELCRGKKLEEYVHFLGKLPYEEAIKLYDNADVFVFPSLRETTGTVIIEAMAKGVPVIAVKQGGACFVITDETGFLISGATKDEYVKNFADAMIRCMNERKMVVDMGYKAYKRIEEFYTWESKIENILPVYEEIKNRDEK